MDDLAKILSQVVEKLGGEGARIWPSLVSQTYVRALFWAIIEPILLIGSSTIFTISLRGIPQDKEVSDMRGFTVTISGCVAILILIIFLFGYGNVLSDVLYPEAATIRNLIGK